MRVLLALVGAVLLSYLVADQIRYLPGDSVAAIVQRPVPVLAAVARADLPAATPAVYTEPASAERGSGNPILLVALDPAAIRYPAQPTDPIGEFALVLSGQDARRAAGLDSSRGLGDAVGRLRLLWPGFDPDAFASTESPAAAAPAAKLPQQAPAEDGARPSNPPSAEMASFEAEEREPEPSAAAAASEPAPADALPISPPVPLARSSAPPRAGAPVSRGAARAKPPTGPAPARQLASVAPDAETPGERPVLACGASACGPRLLLLGVGF